MMIQVREIRVEGVRMLLTLPREDPAEPLPVLLGALVRVLGVPGATPEQVESCRSFVFAKGAAAVKVIPAPVAPPGVMLGVGVSRPEKESLRDVVRSLVEKATGCDRGGLSALVDEIMSEEGL